MPYTIEELQSLDFYNEFRDNLRATHINRLVDYAKNKFRDSNNVLYSFEAVERDSELGIGLGIESSELLETASGPYSELPILLERAVLEYVEENSDFFLQDENEAGFLDDFRDFVKNNSKSKQLNNSFPEYDRNILNSVVDRSFSELVQFRVARRLPNGIRNGDVISRQDSTDFRKWLVQANQRRIFATTDSFYGEDYSYQLIKALPDNVLDSIPEGEPVE
tara:strand:+ start:480 stop:1142 length:663 start_codon:yes stop_codon:yes gene_type:complete